MLERRNRANEELCGMNSNDEWSGQEIDWKINGVKWKIKCNGKWNFESADERNRIGWNGGWFWQALHNEPSWIPEWNKLEEI